MFTEPPGGCRKVSVHQRRIRVDWAREMKEFLDIDYPRGRKIILICDNLNTNKTASFYHS